MNQLKMDLMKILSFRSLVKRVPDIEEKQVTCITAFKIATFIKENTQWYKVHAFCNVL